MINVPLRVFKWTILLLIACTGPVLLAQRGALTAPRNISQLTARSALILRGRVVEAHVERHPTLRGLRTVVVTLRGEEVIKGSAGATYTFRQVIWDVRDIDDKAGYRKGQEWLLFLNAPNEHGLTSPVGLEQGRFKVVERADRKIEVVNGRGNVGLFEGVTQVPEYKASTLSSRARSMVTTHRHGAVMLDSLREVVRSLAGGQQ